MKFDLDRWWRYGRCVTDEALSDNRPYDRRHPLRICPGGVGVRQGSNPGGNPRQNAWEIPHGFHTTSGIAAHKPASPTRSQDAQIPMNTHKIAQSVPKDPDGRGGGIRTHGLFVPNEARYQTALRPDIILEPAGRRAGEGRLQNIGWHASRYSWATTAGVTGWR